MRAFIIHIHIYSPLYLISTAIKRVFGAKVAHLIKMDEVIRIIVKDEEVVLAGYPVDFLPSFQRYDDTGRIRTRRIDVHYFRHFLAGHLSFPENFPHDFRDGTIVVLRDPDEFCLVRCDLFETRLKIDSMLETSLIRVSDFRLID